MRMIKTSGFLALALLAWAGALQAATPAAEVLLLTGRGTAASGEGAVRLLAKGQPVFPGELINTGANSYLNLRFKDGSYILLRPNSRFMIENYTYTGPEVSHAPAPKDVDSASAGQTREVPKPAAAPALAATPTAAAPAGSRAFFKLLRGGFRAVSGLIGKGSPGDYRVSTPVATIGIRGTDYVVILVDPSMTGDPAFEEATGGSAPAGSVVVGVVTGGVFVANAAGQQFDVNAGQYSLTLPDGSTIMLPFDPQFIRVDPIPNPTTFCQ